MQKQMKSLFVALVCMTMPVMAQKTDQVNPIIGTNGMGHTFPGACAPFGIVQVSPDTDTIPHNIDGVYQPRAYEYCAGDQHKDSSIVGFSHTHFSGTGHSDLGDILLMPFTGELQINPGTADNPDSGYRSRFEKSTEQAAPGFYGVTLADYGIKVELTASERVGFHRYTYPQADTARVLFDIGHPQGESAEVVDTRISYDPAERTLKGFLECYPVYATFCDKGNTVKSYFYARLPEKITSFGTYRDSVAYPDSMQISGQGTGM